MTIPAPGSLATESTPTGHGHGHATPGVVQGMIESKDVDHLVLAIPGTDYRFKLALAAGAAPRLPEPGQGVRSQAAGTIRAQAKRIDIVNHGGRFVEPVYGRPRRVQGRVLAIDAAHGAILVHCAPGVGLYLQPMAPQQPSSFAVGQLVACDVERGAAFEPM